MVGFATALLSVVAWGCGGTSGEGRGGSVLCLVAASTTEAVEEIARAFSAETGIRVQVNPDDSSKLATQIVNGAPADLFLSANEKWADYVNDKGLAREVLPLLGNTLVLIVPLSLIHI